VARRIVMIGSTCAGKSTLARELAARLGIPHVELDALHWEPEWTAAPLERFRHRLERALQGGAWVVDGNYTDRARDMVWPLADTVVWLDPPFVVVLMRFVRRTSGRILRREVLWNANRETLRGAVLGRDSLLWWLVSTFARRRREYASLAASAAESGPRFVRLRRRRVVLAWLNSQR
jgi:adenylate kinase family enzyme